MAEKHPFFVPRFRHPHSHNWQPAVDVYRCAGGWLLKCDLAGVRPEDVKVSVQGRRLTIAGIRRDCCIVEGQQAYSLEISYDEFQRTVELPIEIERLNVTTDYRDGMLMISLEESLDDEGRL